MFFHVFAQTTHVVAAPHGFACVGIPATWYYIPSFIEIRLGVSEPQGVNVLPFSLLWLLAFTTACTTVQTTVQAVILQIVIRQYYIALTICRWTRAVYAFCVPVIVSTTAGDVGCNGGWQSNFGNEYCIRTEEKSHEEARDTCHGMNSELASITTDAEFDYVVGLMSVNVCD